MRLKGKTAIVLVEDEVSGMLSLWLWLRYCACRSRYGRSGSEQARF